jgi:hypothetical protein
VNLLDDHPHILFHFFGFLHVVFDFVLVVVIDVLQSKSNRSSQKTYMTLRAVSGVTQHRMILVPSSISSDNPPNLKLSTIVFGEQVEMKLSKILTI